MLALVWVAVSFSVVLELPLNPRGWLGSDQAVILGWRQAGPIHLLLALALSATAFPLFVASPRRAPAAYDWLLVILAASVLRLPDVPQCPRPGARVRPPISGCCPAAIVLLGLAVYRSAGLPLLIVAALIGFYLFFGDRPFMPDTLRWSGTGAEAAMQRIWIGTDGVFGRPLEVCATFVFSLVVLGALMDRAGGSAYIAKCALSLVGHVRGGAVHGGGTVVSRDRDHVGRVHASSHPGKPGRQCR